MSLIKSAVTACAVITALCIAVRLYAQLRIFKEFHLEDHFMILSGLGFGGFCAVLIIIGNAGLGDHSWHFSLDALSQIHLYFNLLQMTYVSTMFVAKVAVLLSLKRIFEVTQEAFVPRSFFILIYLNSMLHVGVLFATIFECVPRAKITNPSLPGKCVSTDGMILASSTCNVLSDLSILALPLYVIWKLSSPLKKKARAFAFFATGLLYVVTPLHPHYLLRMRRKSHQILLQHPARTYEGRHMGRRICGVVGASLPLNPTQPKSPFSSQFDRHTDHVSGALSLFELTSVVAATCFLTFPRFFRHLRDTFQTHVKRISSPRALEENRPVQVNDQICTDGPANRGAVARHVLGDNVRDDIAMELRNIDSIAEVETKASTPDWKTSAGSPIRGVSSQTAPKKV
ncbi:hypothetical protein AAL_02082 [Moelleriella libera RCEF 2490]|uniref:Rhodopsin domain-containing protein n=1 Tax=Moelleriella libera RCEF 2490 TaxID=1081109 RepID=A0A166PWK2_9HYPO|nr:hypothetical protein AAL_02082 [Moelleriella libera RCEF 2490]